MRFYQAADKNSPLEVGDRTKCNEVQGDGREKVSTLQKAVLGHVKWIFLKFTAI